VASQGQLSSMKSVGSTSTDRAQLVEKVLVSRDMAQLKELISFYRAIRTKFSP
jgi:hypothetical protein